MKSTSQPIPHHVVTEFIGQASFSNNEEHDVEIAEQVASSTFTSLEDLYKTCKGAAACTNRIQGGWDKAYKEACTPKSWFQEQINKNRANL